MDEKNYRYKDIIPEERKETTKEWTVKAERKIREKEAVTEGKEKKGGEEKIPDINTEGEAGENREVAEETAAGSSEEGKKQDKDEKDTADDFNVDRTIEDTRDSVKKAIDDVVDLGNTLLGTRKGREHIEKKAKKAGKKLTRTLEYIIEDAGKKIKK